MLYEINRPKAIFGSPSKYVTVTAVINDAGKALMSEPNLYLPSLNKYTVIIHKVNAAIT